MSYALVIMVLTINGPSHSSSTTVIDNMSYGACKAAAKELSNPYFNGVDVTATCVPKTDEELHPQASRELNLCVARKLLEWGNSALIVSPSLMRAFCIAESSGGNP